VLLRDGLIISDQIAATGYQAQAAAVKVYEDLLSRAGLAADAVDSIVATGYGRKRVSFAARTVTEISCHAARARFLVREIRSVVDIGGQDHTACALCNLEVWHRCKGTSY